jgi:hypothetical protein
MVDQEYSRPSNGNTAAKLAGAPVDLRTAHPKNVSRCDGSFPSFRAGLLRAIWRVARQPEKGRRRKATAKPASSWEPNKQELREAMEALNPDDQELLRRTILDFVAAHTVQL